MTLVRRLAVWLSETVRTNASPGCVEWAEALEAELDVIESDWAALGWALGSLRVLLVYRERPWRTMADVEQAAVRWRDRKGNNTPAEIVVRNLGWLLSGLPVVLRHGHSAPGLERAGYWLFVSAWASLGVIPVTRLRAGKVPPEAEGPSLIAFFRNDLKWLSNPLRSPAGLWMAVQVTLLFGGLTLSQVYGWHPVINAVCVLCWAGLMALSVHSVRLNRRRLAQLDRVMAWEQ